MRLSIALCLASLALATGCGLFLSFGRCSTAEDCPSWSQCELASGTCVDRVAPDAGTPVGGGAVEDPTHVGARDGGAVVDAGAAHDAGERDGGDDGGERSDAGAAHDAGELDAGVPCGLLVEAPAVLLTSEAGASDSFTVRLASEPTGEVTVGMTVVSSTDPSLEVALSPPALQFDVDDWQQPKEVVVTGLQDGVYEADAVPFTVELKVGREAAPSCDAGATALVEGSNASADKYLQVSAASTTGVIALGPDAACAVGADGDEASYRALLSFPSAETGGVLQPRHTYYRPSGERIVATGDDGLLPTNTLAWERPISADEHLVWTGFDAAFSPSDDCQGWSTIEGDGRYGMTNQTGPSAWSNGARQCGDALRLLCVEQ